MAFGRSPRMDNRRPSSFCSTATLVVFVALCLVGVWMMTSTTVAPVEMSTPDNKSEVKDQASEGNSRTFEDTSGDLPDDTKRRDANNNANTLPDDSNSEPEKTTESITEKAQEEDPAKSNEEMNDADDMSKKNKFNDAKGNVEGRESNKDNGDPQPEGAGENSEGGAANPQGGGANPEGGDANSGSRTSDQENTTQNNPDETGNNEQEKNSLKNSDETTSNEQDKKSEEIPKDSGNEKQEQSDGSKNSEQDAKSDNEQGQIEDKAGANKDTEVEQSSSEKNSGNQTVDQVASEVFPNGAQSELLNETSTQNVSWSTQAAESRNEKEVQSSSSTGYSWKLCNTTAGTDYIPCLDNVAALKKLHSTLHYEHRERHCPEENPSCLVPLPDGYKRPIEWPNSRDKIWYHNVPHTKLAEIKGHQNWVKVSGEYLTFPGGGTQFVHGALHYIDFIQEALPDIAWGKRSRVILDVGCGVASFGGFLFERDVLTMSFAPKDEHEAQVQFALERGIPAISAVMGTKRLPYPGRVFDVVHCARCRVPWHIEGGKLLLELNRLLRPGGYFVWSATPVYRKGAEDVGIWEAMSALTKSMCWKMVTKTEDSINQVGLAIYQKPANNECYEKRTEISPPLCQDSDDPNAAWNVPLQACMHKLPVDPAVRGSKWPEQWPKRAEKAPYWLNSSQVGVYGKPAPQDFEADYEHWKRVVSTSYLKGMGINWSTVRNVMDMRSVYGGFAAALRDKKVWVMNVVSIDSPDTLPIIYERGLFGMYHDWCEGFSTYPRTYDLLHADHLFSKLKKRCKLVGVIAEVDRMLRPEGKLIIRDEAETINEVEKMAKSLHWEIRLTFSKEKEGLLCVQKTIWRPKEVEESTPATS